MKYSVKWDKNVEEQKIGEKSRKYELKTVPWNFPLYRSYHVYFIGKL